MISSDKIKRGVNLLIFAVVGIIVISILLTFSLEQHYSHYRPLGKEDYLDGKVNLVRTYRDSIYFVINEAKYSIEFEKNKNLKGFIAKGDSISKKSNSDSVLIKRNNTNYLFILNIGYNKNPIAQMNTTVETIIKNLDLQPHPEGGYYKETYRSEGTISSSDLPSEFSGDRNFSTSIYYLLVSDKPSMFHKINQDEIWHFYDGSSIELHTISESGEHKKYVIGRDFKKGQIPQLVVSANHWFASRVVDPDSYSLVGCTVSPGFNFDDFIIAERDDLVKSFPQHQQLIEDFTR